MGLTAPPERVAVEAYIEDVERRLRARTTEGPEALLAAFVRTLDHPNLVVRHNELRYCENPEIPKVFSRHLRVLAADAPRLHGLTPSLAIIDELHAHVDDSVYLAMKTAQLKRPGSKLIVISTAGAGADSPLGRLRSRALAQPHVTRRGQARTGRAPRMAIARRCLRCNRRTRHGSYCPTCQRVRDSAYNSTSKRTRARATIAASPRCEICGATADRTADHLIPVIDGGASGPLRVLCRSCNSQRGDKPAGAAASGLCIRGDSGIVAGFVYRGPTLGSLAKEGGGC